MALNSDKDAIGIAVKTCNGVDFLNPKIVRIKNTLELYEIEVSEAYLEELNKSKTFTILTEPYPIQFAEDGRLV
jgi:hypothetical protein